ncbi:MAG: hypothetical protein HY951_00580 [Bacteroidia bacterium]|nr:hypothetical protein [Bacteroidia bacterium]
MKPNINLTLILFLLINLSFGQAAPKEILDSIYNSDQKYRNMLDSIFQKYGKESEEYKGIWNKININDSINLTKVISILDKYGWLGDNLVGKKGNSALFLVIQHSDLKTQEKYKPMMENAVKNGQASAASFALLTDRIEMGKGKPQIYGSQVQGNRTNGYKLYPIFDEINVNIRRKEVGLQPLEEYLKQWNIEYKIPKK